jgi:hypothetical protein
MGTAGMFVYTDSHSLESALLMEIRKVRHHMFRMSLVRLVRRWKTDIADDLTMRF